MKMSVSVTSHSLKQKINNKGKLANWTKMVKCSQIEAQSAYYIFMQYIYEDLSQSTRESGIQGFSCRLHVWGLWGSQVNGKRLMLYGNVFNKVRRPTEMLASPSSQADMQQGRIYLVLLWQKHHVNTSMRLKIEPLPSAQPCETHHYALSSSFRYLSLLNYNTCQWECSKTY